MKVLVTGATGFVGTEWCGNSPASTGATPALNRDQLIMLAENHTGDPTPAGTWFDLSVGSFREGIARCLTGGPASKPPA